MINKARAKQFEYEIIANTIDNLMRERDSVTESLRSNDDKYRDTGDGWYDEQSNLCHLRIDAYTAIMDYLEKYR